MLDIHLYLKRRVEQLIRLAGLGEASGNLYNPHGNAEIGAVRHRSGIVVKLLGTPQFVDVGAEIVLKTVILKIGFEQVLFRR